MDNNGYLSVFGGKLAARLPRSFLKHMLTNVLVQGFKRDELNTERFLNLRYDGTDVPVMTLCPPGGDFAQASPPATTERRTKQNRTAQNSTVQDRTEQNQNDPP